MGVGAMTRVVKPSAWINRQVGRRGKVIARAAALLVAGGVAVVLLRSDVIASLTAVAATVAGVMAARWRKPTVFRGVAAGLVFCIAAGAAMVALALPSYHGTATPLAVASDGKPLPPRAGNPVREVIGFVDSDANDSEVGVDRDASRVSTVAATTATLAAAPGAVDITDAGDTLVHAHAAGAAALAVVSNATDTGFNGNRAAAELEDPVASGRLVQRIADLLRAGWDGVVLDFEELPATSRAHYPSFVADLRRAVGDRRILVATPAFTEATATQGAGYDLTALAQTADAIVWMAYDQHDRGSEPGPVAGLPWLKDSVATALRQVLADRLLLGIAGFGYHWDQPGSAHELTYDDAIRLGHQPGTRVRFDPTQAETEVTTPDGTTAWYADSASIRVRAALAQADGLAGVALWRLGSEDPAALAELPFPPRTHPLAPGTAPPMQQVGGHGLVALTFDDGPDPTWTPQLLEVLRRKRVPATFFAIGQAAEDNPDIVRAEIAEGHVVGDHTHSHPNLTTLPDWRVRYEIWRGSAAIEQATGYRPRLFRAPYGEGDNVVDRTGDKYIGNIVRDAGLYPVPWNVDSVDFTRPGVDTIVNNVVSAVRGRSIVLLHDGGGDRSQTIAAVERIIDTLRDRGYVFLTVDALHAGAGAPYLPRATARSVAAGFATIAGLRILTGVRLALEALLFVGVAVGLLRAGVGIPTAFIHARRQGRARRRRGPPAIPDGLRIAVLIPARNEDKVIAQTLASLAACDPAPHEVVVIDDGSTDNTAAVARSCAHLLPQLRVITKPNGGKADALNTGIAATTADIVIVVDADTVVTPSAIGALSVPFEDPRVGAVAGNVKVGNRRNPLAALQSLEYVISLNIDRRTQDQLRMITVVPGAAGGFRRTALAAVGGYSADTIVEDADLTQALLGARWRIRYAADAVVHTEAPQTFTDVIRQRRRWSFGTVQVVAKHAPALLDPKSGRAGMIGLPWLLASQLVLPAAGPLADLWLILRLIDHRFGVVAVAVLLAVALDLLLAAVAVALDGESWAMVCLSPFLRLIWRPLQLLVIARAVMSWLSGRTESWRQITRYGGINTTSPAAHGAGPRSPAASQSKS